MIWQPASMAQSATPETTGGSTPASATDDLADEQATRFRIELSAPEELRPVIRASVDLYRWRASDALTRELLQRLAHQAVEETREALATEGYFSPEVEATLRTAPDGTEVVTLSAKPGMRTTIADVALELTGGIERDPDLPGRLRALQNEWRLPRGATFRQNDWDRAKRDALQLLAVRDYPVPRIADSEASIDPAAGEARLRLRIDSGPQLRFGAINVTGLVRYEPARVRNFAAFETGDAWDREKVTRFQRRLTASGYFASAQVELDSEAAKDGIAPVNVRVIEAPSRRLEVGLGYSSDALLRTSASWRNQDFAGKGLRWRSDLRIESRLQSASTSFDLPETGGGWARSLGAELKRADVQELLTEGLTLSGRLRTVEERDQREYGVQAIYERTTPTGQLSAANHATLIEHARTWRDFDDLLSPTRGRSLQVVGGVAPPAVSTQGLARVLLRSLWLQPVGRRLDLSIRAEAGAVFSSSRNGIPQALLFRLGGDNDLRGYAFGSVGIRTGDVVSGARRYVLASAELTYWIGENWGIAGFVDSGDAFDRGQPMRLNTGVGFGARVRTPIGPLRADLAWSEHSRSPRLHFSVGLQF